MIRVAAWCLDLSDSTLNRLVQLGVDAADGSLGNQQALSYSVGYIKALLAALD